MTELDIGQIKQFVDVPSTVSCRIVVGKKNGNIVGIKDNGKLMIPTTESFVVDGIELSKLVPETRVYAKVMETHDNYDRISAFTIYSVDDIYIVAPAYVDYGAYADQLRFILNQNKETWMRIQPKLKAAVTARQATSMPLT